MKTKIDVMRGSYFYKTVTVDVEVMPIIIGGEVHRAIDIEDAEQKVFGVLPSLRSRQDVILRFN